MKKLLCTVMAITAALAVWAHTPCNQPACKGAPAQHEPNSLSVTPAAAASATYRYTLAKDRITHQAEEHNSTLQYNRTMGNMLHTLEIARQQEKLENLQAHMQYNSTMTAMLQHLEQEKMQQRLDDLQAAFQYTRLMSTMLNDAVDRE